MSRCRLVVLTVVLLGCVSAVSGQPTDDGTVRPYFDCPYVNYFDTDCPQLREQRPLPGAQGQNAAPEPQPGMRQPDEKNNGDEQEGTRQGVLPEELVLFPRESLAPDAPPLFRILLAQPTLANARRYLRWHARRTAQLQVVQALIQRAGKELEANPGRSLQPLESGDQAESPGMR